MFFDVLSFLLFPLLLTHISFCLYLSSAGVRGTYTGNIPAIERLGIPALKMQDGPQGFRTSSSTGGDGTSTAWPSALTIAASWDSDLVYRWASAMAEEFKAKGANMALAPGLGIARVPTAGRNFEYLCGEDPVLGSTMAKSSVQGIQDQGIIANAKHFVNNEIEDHRMTVSANVNERVRFELYYPPFEAAIEAGVLSVMCAYNRINDVYACQNNDTLTHLRENLGFNGWVVSDWTATKSSVNSLLAGMDQEMPLGLFYNHIVLEALLLEHKIKLEDIDRSVFRILHSMEKIGLMDSPLVGDPTANVTSSEHNALAREISAKSTVLLKNSKSILPLDKNQLGDCVAVIGNQDIISGGGSGSVSPPYVITPKQGIETYLAGTNTVVYYNNGEDVSAAVALAEKCTLAIVVVATTSSEGSDRDTLSLGDAQNNLVSSVAAVNSQTIVDVVAPGAVLMPWATMVSAILVSWMPGQEAGNGFADVLFGVVNPSARLPVTIPNKDNEVGFTPEQYPGTGAFMREAAYTEELLIGYRWYDAYDVVPLYPFGHGLSYTTFEYSALKLQVTNDFPSEHADRHSSKRIRTVVDVVVKNVGPRDGSEVIQVYLSFPSEAGEPLRQLRAFKKVSLKSQSSSIVQFALTNRDFSIWNSELHNWELVAGTFTVFIGASSRDLRLQEQFVISA